MFVKTGYTSSVQTAIIAQITENAQEAGFEQELIEAATGIFKQLAPVAPLVATAPIDVVTIQSSAVVLEGAGLPETIFGDVTFVVLTDGESSNVLLPALNAEDADALADKVTTSMIRTNTPVSAALGQVVDELFKRLDESGVDLKAMSEELRELVGVGIAYLQLQNAMGAMTGNQAGKGGDLEEMAKAFSVEGAGELGEQLDQLFKQFKTQ